MVLIILVEVIFPYKYSFSLPRSFATVSAQNTQPTPANKAERNAVPAISSEPLSKKLAASKNDMA